MKQRPLSPHLQIYRPQITWVPSIMHRFAGVWNTVFLVWVVFWLYGVASGSAIFDAIQSFLGTPLGLALLASHTLAFFFHLGNGVRHLLWDAGWGYRVSTAAATAWFAIGFAVIATALLWTVILSGGAV